MTRGGVISMAKPKKKAKRKDHGVKPTTQPAPPPAGA
jgi:hypothetical protein